MESIRVSKKHRTAIGLLITIAVLGTILVESFIYYAAKTRLINEIERQMTIGAYSAESILGDDYHNGLISGERQIPPEQEYKDAYNLTHFAQHSGFDYVYTMIKLDEDILFVSSSLTPSEIAKDDEYENVFLTKYEEAPEALKQIFTTLKSAPAKYNDRWGSFLSMFVPMRSSDGSLYVIGVDMSVEHVKAASQINALVALAPLILIVVLSIPITWILVYALKSQANAEIEQLYRDNITGLANRNKLNLDLENTGLPVLLIMNIDRFREISNAFGPAVGDIVLAEFGHHITCFQHKGLLPHKSYRLQGDEFAVLFDQKIESGAKQKPFDKFYTFVNNFKYTGLPNREIALSVTVGGAFNKTDCTLLADMALRHAKYNHQGMVIYDDQLDLPKIYRDNQRNVEQLRLALVTHRVVPFFQPIFSVKTNEVAHYEVLARVVNEQGEIIMNPIDFIPLAERYRLHGKVTKAMFENTIMRMKGNNHRIHFNLSIKDIEETDTANYILKRIKKSGMANRISIELLEHESMRAPKTLKRFFIKMRHMGCQVGIDDLGREYSNFDRIIELPLDFIKIDGPVIHRVAADPNMFDIVEKIVVASKASNIETVAECIDSNRVKETAIKLGVDYLQGFTLGTPQPDFKIIPIAEEYNT